jgi:hypothetical protein
LLSQEHIKASFIVGDMAEVAEPGAGRGGLSCTEMSSQEDALLREQIERDNQRLLELDNEKRCYNYTEPC